MLIKISAVLVLLLLVSPALAQQTRDASVNMTLVLHDEAGVPLPDAYSRTRAEQLADPDCAKCERLTVGLACAHALNYSTVAERDMEAGQKWARSALAARIEHEKDAKLTAKEIAVIQAVVPKLYPGVVIAQMFLVLDPNAKPPELK